MKLIMKYCLLFLAIALGTQCFAQKIDEMDIYMHRTVTVDHDSLVIKTSILEEDLKVPIDYSRYYYWYKMGEVLRTRGGYSGKVLHGSYAEFFPNKSIRINGSFYLGMKNGEWKEWMPNGELVSIINWLKGVKHGKYMEFDDEGHVRVRGNYKKGLKEGNWEYYTNGIIDSTSNYKSGEIVAVPEGEQKGKKKKKETKKQKRKKKQEKEGGKSENMTPVIDAEDKK